MSANRRVGLLADHPEALPALRAGFEAEWETYYGPAGPGDAALDLMRYSSRGELPIGLVAFFEDELCGIAVLKADSISTHSHLSPWAAAGFVFPEFRRRGIGTYLLHALEGAARKLGYSRIYTGTSTAAGLLTRNGWQLMEQVRYDGEDLSIYEKALFAARPL